MSKTVEAFNYRIGLDVSKLQAGGIITKRELSQLRRDFYRLQEPAEQSAATVKRLTDAFRVGAMDQKTYATAMERITARQPEAIAARKAQTAAETDAAAIRRKLMTDDERYRAEQLRMIDMINRGNLTRAEATRHLKEYKSQLPSVVAAERERVAVEKEASAVRRRLQTDSERYADEVRRIRNLVDRGSLTQSEATRHLREYRSQLPAVVAAEERRADLQRRGAALTDRYATASERLTRELREERRELDRLRKAGAIDETTFRRGVADIARRGAPQRPDSPSKPKLRDEIDNMPMIGGLAGRGASLVRMGPAIAGLAVGLGAAYGAYRLASSAASAFSQSVAEQADLVVKMDRSARMLGTSVQDYAAIQFAASQNAGMSADQTMVVVTKLSAKISEAAAGGGDALASIQALGLDASKLALEDPAIAFRQIVQAASEVANPIDRARIAAKLFEEEGLALADVLAGGAKGLDDAKRAADRYGLTVNDVQSLGLTNAVDSVGELQAIWDGWARQVTVEFAPAVTAIAQTISGMAPMAGEMGGGITQAADSAVELAAYMAETSVYVTRFTRLLYEAGTRDIIGLGVAIAKAFEPVTVGDDIRNNYLAAKKAAEEGAAKRKEEAEASRQIAAEQVAAKQNAAKVVNPEVDNYAEELRQLKERNRELTLGAEASDAYLLKNAEIDEPIKQEIAALRERNKELENAQKLRDQENSLRDQVEKAKIAEQLRNMNPRLSDRDSEELAGLQQQGATPEQLQRTFEMRRELELIEQRNKARDTERDRLKSLAAEAAKITETQRGPVAQLATELTDLHEMRMRNLLTEAEFEAAKRNAAMQFVDIPDDLATAGGDITDGSQVYAAMVDDQNVLRKNEIEQAEADRLEAAAMRLAGIEQQRVNQAIEVTAQMQQQAALAERIAGGDAIANRSTEATTTKTAAEAAGGDVFERIAIASEQASSALSQWQIIGV
ncbi:hypothetical protein [Neorhodopirellula pilleata]|uniref:Uncharacterized protein n=1 Tax=Neorhodopirellula pilleata TaxID=2714738 RepID=A0A5C5ZWE9_9BACT|nr:hypothetical protein [Neorhodopirellula pilleata]TWT91386.1 hypothetical protein Pla100_52360 [Neorhodopirellula pilleata]TWT91435.1 hypothetical protein Pla100_52850 [Neorhodopirellula pilleata]